MVKQGHKYKILVTNQQLDKIGGTETFTFTLIEALKSLGHHVEYFTLKKGFVSTKIEEELEVPFMNSSKYDLILANHKSTVNKVFHLGYVIQTCHGVFPEVEQPSKYSDAFVSISKEVQSHLTSLGICSRLIHNSLNLKRFYPRIPVCDKLTSVLSLSQSKDLNRKLEKICKNRGLKFASINKFSQQLWDMEDYYNQHDLIIGLGRSAYEAMASGRPVFVFDHRPYYDNVGDGYVTTTNFKELLECNFSGRKFRREYNEEKINKEFDKYDFKDGAQLRKLAEDNFDVETNVWYYLEFIEQARKVTIFEVAKKKIRKSKLDLFVKRKEWSFN